MIRRDILIRWIDGGRWAGPEDTERAEEAAIDVFSAAGLNDVAQLMAAEDAYRRALEDGEEPMGLGAIWADALNAANGAAVQGWHDPNGGAVDIVVVRGR